MKNQPSDYDLATAKLNQARSILCVISEDDLESFDRHSNTIKTTVIWACESLVDEALELLTSDGQEGAK